MLFRCSRRIEHGYTILASSNSLQESSVTSAGLEIANDVLGRNYYFGDVVGYSCHSGYKFQDNHNLMAEFRLRCTENGTWIGFVRDCVPLLCSWPNAVANGKIFLRTHSNDTIQLSNRQAAPSVSNTKSTETERGSSLGETDLENQLVLGSQILIKCDVGYKLIGDGVRTCTDREEWSSTLSSCQPYECSISEHPLFPLINKVANSDNHTNTWDNNQNKELGDRKAYNGFYGSLEYFVEGYTYTKKIVLTCKNAGEIKLTSGNTDGHVSNLTWSCNENGKWEILHLKMNDTVIEDLLGHRMEDICDELMCPLATVSTIRDYPL